jgi:hypothetical protein
MDLDQRAADTQLCVGNCMGTECASRTGHHLVLTLARAHIVLEENSEDSVVVPVLEPSSCPYSNAHTCTIHTCIRRHMDSQTHAHTRHTRTHTMHTYAHTHNTQLPQSNLHTYMIACATHHHTAHTAAHITHHQTAHTPPTLPTVTRTTHRHPNWPPSHTYTYTHTNH